MNIYQIEQDLIEIFDELENNGGELTPELEARLTISQEEFKDKIEEYSKVITMLSNDINGIKEEQRRLKELADRKEKTIERIKNVMLKSVEQFGNTKNTGVKYVDYGTGVVSIRRSTAVDVDKDLLKEIGNVLEQTLAYMKSTNQIGVADKVDADTMLTILANGNTDKDDINHAGYMATEDDLNHTNVELSLKMSLKDLLNGNNYDIIKALSSTNVEFTTSTSISKTEIKKELEDNGACAPNLARLVENKSLIIK